MYLALLSKEQKELFLELALNVASADGNYSDEERIAIEGYCREMQLVFEHEKKVKPIEIIIEKLDSLCDDKIKKIVVFEIIGLAMIDNDYDDNERKIVNSMVTMFKLETKFAEECETILNEYISFCNKINQLIIE